MGSKKNKKREVKTMYIAGVDNASVYVHDFEAQITPNQVKVSRGLGVFNYRTTILIDQFKRTRARDTRAEALLALEEELKEKIKDAERFTKKTTEDMELVRAFRTKPAEASA